MKITPEHYNVLAQAITLTRIAQPEATLEYYTNLGLTAKRWRWDLLWDAKRCGRLPARFVEDTLYSYCNDDHIDTALRKITASS